MKNKNVVLYGVIALVAVVAIAFFTGRIPPKGNLEGTIGGANRYQSEQISQADVVLKDAEVQAFLQSDTFHQIQTNPELAAVLSDPGVNEALRIKAFPGLLGNSDALRALKGTAGEAYRRMIKGDRSDLATTQIKALVSDELVRRAIREANTANVANEADFATIVAHIKGGDALARRYHAIWSEFSTMVAGSADAAAVRVWLSEGDNLTILADDGFAMRVKAGLFDALKQMPSGWNDLLTTQRGGFDKLVAVDGLAMRVKDIPHN